MVAEKPVKDSERYATFNHELPFSGGLNQSQQGKNRRHGQAWDLRLYDGHGEPSVVVVKGKKQ